MVIDMPRLPGVLAAGGLSLAPLSQPEGGPRCVWRGRENPHPSHTSPSRAERGMRNARHVDLIASPRRGQPDPRSGTELEAGACPGRRPAA